VTYLLVILSGVCDWIRGGHNYGSRILELSAKFGQGAALGYLGHCPYYLLPACALLFWLGEKPGWGYPTGYAYTGKDPDLWDKTPHGTEWWQPRFLKHKPYLSLSLRGIIWGAPTLALLYWWPLAWIIAVSMALTMPISVFLAKPVKKVYLGEPIRGFLTALCIALWSSYGL